MYNRYIPQNDGSFQRNRIQDHPPHKPAPPPPMPPPPPNPEPVCHHPPQGSSVPHFLRQLLPKDFDTGDLIVILLLLLMAGDSPEDRSNAILTLALYFIM